MKPIRVLVVDDSRFMVSLISSVLETAGDIVVAGFALDGEEAVRKARELRPDVITMDVVMPRMDGLDATRAIAAQLKIPIIILSAHTTQGADLTIQALQAGAVDCLAKPSGEISMSLETVAQQLVDKVRGLAPRDPPPSPAIPDDRPLTSSYSSLPAVSARPHPAGPPAVVAFGASTGGIQALQTLLPRFDSRIPFSILIIQHFPEGFTSQLALRLDAICSIRVAEAQPGQRLARAAAFLAPGGTDMEITQGLRIRLSAPEGVPSIMLPSVDTTFRSLARNVGPAAVGVILTGMGKDGSQGAAELFRAGGRIVVEDHRTATAWGMPRSTLDSGCYDAVLPLNQIAGHILRMAGL